MKEETEEDCTIEEEEQLVLKQEGDTFMVTPTYEGSEHSEPEPDSDHQIFHVSESQDQTGDRHEDSGSSIAAEQEPNKRRSEAEHDIHTGKESLKCDICGKAFGFKSKLQRHLRVHTGEKPYVCKFCGQGFGYMSVLKTHLPQQHVCTKEEDLTDQQLCDQERSSSLDPEDPEPPQMKEEKEEDCTSQEGEQLVVKQEEETLMVTPTCEEIKDETLDFIPDKSQS
ncbi:hypothetical protein GBF38_004224, partial [Nibea albiflora]